MHQCEHPPTAEASVVSLPMLYAAERGVFARRIVTPLRTQGQQGHACVDRLAATMNLPSGPPDEHAADRSTAPQALLVDFPEIPADNGSATAHF